jgi:hypothetical protein
MVLAPSPYTEELFSFGAGPAILQFAIQVLSRIAILQDRPQSIFKKVLSNSIYEVGEEDGGRRKPPALQPPAVRIYMSARGKAAKAARRAL